jgi:hypothetical protein
MPKTAYVVEGYVPNGGTYMAYHVARILHIDFGYEVCVVTEGPGDGQGHMHGSFPYDPVFPSIPLAACEDIAGSDDVLICNPSFSMHNLGLRLRCRKLMYVQGFNTFSLLDCYFDHYVAVSSFVRGFLSQTYGIHAPVIPAFIPDSRFILHGEAVRDTVATWEARLPFSVEVNIKGDWAHQRLLLDRVCRELKAKDRGLEEIIDWDAAVERSRSRLPRDRFLERVSSARYLLTLSVAEGFGLVPLEAMGMGTVVLGFDGYGGREYMVPGQNCAVVRYPDVSGLVDGIIHAMRDPAFSQRIAAAGGETASRYTYEAFRNAWVQELRGFLSR